MKVLSIVASAYRGTLEEQDDTIVWISHAMKGAGADLALLLQHNAVNYGVTTQDASGLSFGAKAQTQLPRLDADVAALMAKGVTVYVVDDDLAARGIDKSELIDGLTRVARADLPGLFGSYDQIWHW